jgi:enterochelin esterase-like enzyme
MDSNGQNQPYIHDETKLNMDSNGQNQPYIQRFIDAWESTQFQCLRTTNIAKSILESKCGAPPFVVPGDIDASGDLPQSFHLNHRGAKAVPATDRSYTRCKESIPLPHVPSGTLVEYKNWSRSVVYPGTCRNFDVYLPANTTPNEELGLLFIPDGRAAWQFATHITTVLDNLIHTKRIPRIVLVLMGVGWEPHTGALAMQPKELFPTSLPGFLQRWTELDLNSTNYGTMIVKEVLPFIATKHHIRFTRNPRLKCMAGQSSAGMCAFNVAWQMPAEFGLTLGVSTSFCNSITGSLLAREVRLTPKKDLKIALFVGEHDNSLDVGDWCEQTKLMGKALAFRQYESIVEVAKGGGHTLRYTSMRLAYVLEWLFDNRGGSEGTSGTSGSGNGNGNNGSGSIEDTVVPAHYNAKL